MHRRTMLLAGALAFRLTTQAQSQDPVPLGLSEAGGAAVFRVWAPNATAVDVIGDFNNWKAGANHRLQKDPATGIWSVTLERSPPSGAYQFLINGQWPRRDPYARAVTPDGKKSLAYDPSAFRWESDRTLAIAAEDLVIYELHIGTFNDPQPGDGRPATFADAIERLDTIRDLGVNAVCVMPIHEFSGMHSWGYNGCDLFAVEQSYGGPDGFKTFVKACHSRGIAVHLDIVHNHYGPENLDLLQFDGSGEANAGGLYFYSGGGIAMTPWGPRVKFAEPMVQRFIADNARMWLEEYHVDGFRWDSTVNIRAYDQGASPLPEGQRMLDDINQMIRSRFPGRLSIAEDSLDIGTFHASWDYDFHHEVMPALQARSDAERDLNTLVSALRRRPAAMARVVYVDNHDEAGKINNQFRIATDVDPVAPGGEYARKMCGLGAVLTFTAPGIPLLFMGNEMQEVGAFHDDRPLDWALWKKNAGLVALHRDLIRLRRNLDGAGNALKGLGIDVPLRDHGKKTVVYWRRQDQKPDDPMVIVLNLSGQAQEVTIPFPAPGPWITRLNTEWNRYGGAARQEMEKPFSTDPNSRKGTLTLPGYSARLFALSPGAAAAPLKTAPATAGAEPAAPEQAFSLYASINVIGTFNDWNLTAWPMTLRQDGVWEYYAEFTNARDVEFRLSANDDGKIFWGAGPVTTPTAPGQTAVLKRLGGSIVIPWILEGPYLFYFQEESLSLTIEQTTRRASGQKAAGLVTAAFRQWTDSRGKKVEARLVSATAKSVVLEERSGKQLNVPVSSLSEADQAIVREFLVKPIRP